MKTHLLSIYHEWIRVKTKDQLFIKSPIKLNKNSPLGQEVLKTMKTNKETVEAIYQAFGQGNIPFILDTVSNDFTWTDPSNPAVLPQGGTFVGKSGFLDFFGKLDEKIDTTHFEVDSYLAEGNTVVAAGKHGVRIKTSGQEYTTNWLMIWDFENGKPVKGRSAFDTNQYEALFV